MLETIVTNNSTYTVERLMGCAFVTRVVDGIDSLGDVWPSGTTVPCDDVIVRHLLLGSVAQIVGGPMHNTVTSQVHEVMLSHA